MQIWLKLFSILFVSVCLVSLVDARGPTTIRKISVQTNVAQRDERYMQKWLWLISFQWGGGEYPRRDLFTATTKQLLADRTRAYISANSDFVVGVVIVYFSIICSLLPCARVWNKRVVSTRLSVVTVLNWMYLSTMDEERGDVRLTVHVCLCLYWMLRVV